MSSRLALGAVGGPLPPALDTAEEDDEGVDEEDSIAIFDRRKVSVAQEFEERLLSVTPMMVEGDVVIAPQVGVGGDGGHHASARAQDAVEFADQ